MERSKAAVIAGAIALLIGLAGLVVHVDAFLDARVIGNPLSRAALRPLGVTDLEGAVERSIDATDGGQWLFAVLQAADDGELGIAYSLIDAGAESLAKQLTAAHQESHLPVLYLLKGYMYASVTPWWLFVAAAGGGAWLRAWGKSNPWR
jgi:hypothetical protein